MIFVVSLQKISNDMKMKKLFTIMAAVLLMAG